MTQYFKLFQQKFKQINVTHVLIAYEQEYFAIGINALQKISIHLIKNKLEAYLPHLTFSISLQRISQ